MDNTIDGCETNRQKNMYVEGVIKNSQTPMILIPLPFLNLNKNASEGLI